MGHNQIQIFWGDRSKRHAKNKTAIRALKKKVKNLNKKVKLLNEKLARMDKGAQKSAKVVPSAMHSSNLVSFFKALAHQNGDSHDASDYSLETTSHKPVSDQDRKRKRTDDPDDGKGEGQNHRPVPAREDDLVTDRRSR